MINRYLVKPLKFHRLNFALSVGFGIAQAFCLLGEYYLLAQVISGVIFSNFKLEDALPKLAIALLLAFAKMLFDFLEEKFSKKYTQAILRDYRQNILEKIERIGAVHMARQPMGKIFYLVDSGIDILGKYYSGYIPQLIKGVFIPVFFLIFVFAMDLKSALIMLFTIFLIPIFMVLIGSWTRKVSLKQWKLITSLSAYLRDVLAGIETLKVIGRSKEQYRKILEFSERHSKATVAVQKWAFLSALALELIGTISIALIAVGLGIRLVDGNMDFTIAFFILLLAPEYYQPMRQLGVFFHASLDADATAEDLMAFLEEEEEIVWGEKTLGKIQTIEFKEVSYRYPGSTDWAIQNLSFKVGEKGSLALVGPSGSGKTTVLELLLGNITPDSGEILFNGLKREAYRKESFYHEIAHIEQQPFMVQGTVRENASLYSPAKEETFIAAYQDVFQNLPEGYETKIGLGGQSLSGGQKALVAIARAVNSDKSLVLLDEPTSEIDLATEKALMQTLPELIGKRISVTIAHRLSTIREVDEIILLNHGQVVEQGPWQKLALNPFFQHMRGGALDE